MIKIPRDLEIQQPESLDLEQQLDAPVQMVVKTGNVIERVEDDKESLGGLLIRVKQRMWQLGAGCWRREAEHRETDAKGVRSVGHKSD